MTNNCYQKHKEACEKYQNLVELTFELLCRFFKDPRLILFLGLVLEI